MLKYLYFLMLISLFQGFTLSAQTPDNKIDNDPVSKNTTSSFLEYNDPLKENTDNLNITKIALRMTFSLMAVLALMLLTLFIIKKFFPKTAGISSDKKIKLVKIIEQVPLSTKEKIHLVWSVDRILVLGSSDKGLALLSEIKDQNVIEDKIPSDFTDILANKQLNMAELYNAK